MGEALSDRRGTNGLIAILEREPTVFREVLGDRIVERETSLPHENSNQGGGNGFGDGGDRHHRSLVPRNFRILSKGAKVAIEYNLTVLDNSYGAPGNFRIGICRRNERLKFGKGWLSYSCEAC